MNTKHQQQGSTLVIALVMLIVLTLLVVSAMKSSTINLRITGNMQMQEEAAMVAQKAIETLISNNFTNTANPSSITLPPVDVNNDGFPDYNASAAAPACLSSNPLYNTDLSRTNPADADCFSSDAAINTGIVFASGPTAAKTLSWCSNQQWDVLGAATDTSNTVNVRVHQGVGMRVPAGTNCP